MSAGTDMADTPPELRAVAIAREIEAFELLIEDLDAVLGEAWGALTLEEGRPFLLTPEARQVEFLVIAIDAEDEADPAPAADLIRAAVHAGHKVILVAQDVGPMTLHQLMRLGAEEFVPYPLPEGALAEAIARVTAPPPQPEVPAAAAPAAPVGDRQGIVLPVHGLAGGVGATTFAVNLAWELAELGEAHKLRCCVLDLDLQYGSVATYLDLERRDAVYELLSDTEVMDDEAFRSALLTHGGKLDVLTAPFDALPLDFIAKEDVVRLLDHAKRHYDFVVVDMPTTLVTWSETVLQAADVYFALIELDMRSAQNALRFIRTLKAEELPFEIVRYVLNRAPGRTDLSGRSRVRKLAESLDIAIEVQLPDGGKAVTNANDQGLTLAEAAHKNALRREIHKLAKSIVERATATDQAA
ncbi:MAG: pilus assembly protein CpaE [Alphaproteobacteria bacterium]|nr:MAG: pilus assembly protein CpaE [Alphaproteobacteria bacterium]